MLLYITGGAGFVICLLAIVLILVFHAAYKPKVIPVILFFLGFVLFMGSGFLHSTGFVFGSSGEDGSGGSLNDGPLDLTGEWKQTNSESEDSFHGIYISNDTIEIYWVSDGGNTTALYWSGSYVPPSDKSKEYTWESENDTDSTGTALFASSDETKAFSYKDGKLSYSASALGVTTTIEAERQEWGYKPAVTEPDNNTLEPPEDDIGQENEDSQDTENTPDISLKDISDLLEIVISEHFENYNLSQDENTSTIIVNLWQDGIALELAAIQTSGGDSSNENWAFLKNSMISMSDSMIGVIEAAGRYDVHLLINVLNDQNTENTLLSLLDSVIFYDALDS